MFLFQAMAVAMECLVGRVSVVACSGQLTCFRSVLIVEISECYTVSTSRHYVSYMSCQHE